MKALVLNGERKGERVLSHAHESVVRVLSTEGWSVEPVLLREKEIAGCTGCFGCWTKTPGVCVRDDFGRELAGMAVGCDLLIYLTAVTFGGYSSELKKAIDRFACPMLLPFFTKVDGEVHHRARYRPLPRLLGIGVLPGPEEESERIFARLVERNAVNLHSPAARVVVCYGSQTPEQMEERLTPLLRELGR